MSMGDSPPPSGVAPTDPRSPSGRKSIRNAVKQIILDDNKQILPKQAETAAGWIVESEAQQADVVAMAHLLDKTNVYFTRSRRQEAKYIKAILQLMSNHEGIVEGTHYDGHIELTSKGHPKINTHNKAIKITPQGAFVMFGQLINDNGRVSFLNSVFRGMVNAAKINAEMRREFDLYKAAYEEEKKNRCKGMQSLREAAASSLGVPLSQQVDGMLMSMHKAQYRSYFMGKEPTPAMREAGLLAEGEKAGKIWPQFSPHGQLADNFRLSTNAEAIKLRQDEIQAQPDPESKKRELKKVMSECEAYFRENKVFEIPGATRIQNTRAFINKEPIAKRARI